VVTRAGTPASRLRYEMARDIATSNQIEGIQTPRKGTKKPMVHEELYQLGGKSAAYVATAEGWPAPEMQGIHQEP